MNQRPLQTVFISQIHTLHLYLLSEAARQSRRHTKTYGTHQPLNEHFFAGASHQATLSRIALKGANSQKAFVQKNNGGRTKKDATT